MCRNLNVAIKLQKYKFGGHQTAIYSILKYLIDNY